MRATSIPISIICLLMGACARPTLVEAGLSGRDQTDQAIVREYFLAINARDLAALSKVLAENLTVSVGNKSWGKATEIKNRTDQWARDPNYSVEIRSITGSSDAVRVKISVTYMAQGRRQSQEIENVFQVQNRQITQAVLSP